MKRFTVPRTAHCDGGALAMTAPEPLDDLAVGGTVETRGGDRPEDYVVGVSAYGPPPVTMPNSGTGFQLELPFDEDADEE